MLAVIGCLISAYVFLRCCEIFDRKDSSGFLKAIAGVVMLVSVVSGTAMFVSPPPPLASIRR